jgi:MFS-type transporter involved in bile tolerance (Atg22 family)
MKKYGAPHSNRRIHVLTLILISVTLQGDAVLCCVTNGSLTHSFELVNRSRVVCQILLTPNSTPMGNLWLRSVMLLYVRQTMNELPNWTVEAEEGKYSQ